ncbi:MAG: hypothetical protein PHP45_01135 [Elusimicrobiales bacterium]|nr:hypothetical protein [Elusimicrobiales bacterium]
MKPATILISLVFIFSAMPCVAQGAAGKCPSAPQAKSGETYESQVAGFAKKAGVERALMVALARVSARSAKSAKSMKDRSGAKNKISAHARKTGKAISARSSRGGAKAGVKTPEAAGRRGVSVVSKAQAGADSRVARGLSGGAGKTQNRANASEAADKRALSNRAQTEVNAVKELMGHGKNKSLIKDPSNLFDSDARTLLDGYARSKGLSGKAGKEFVDAVMSERAKLLAEEHSTLPANDLARKLAASDNAASNRYKQMEALRSNGPKSNPGGASGRAATDNKAKLPGRLPGGSPVLQQGPQTGGN